MLNAIKRSYFNLKTNLYRVMDNDRGDFYISDAVKIILAVVLGALLLAALTLLFNNVILPRIETEITSLFG